MGIYDKKPCPCGSGHDSWWESDARGIPLCRVCESCQKTKLAKYRPEVLANPQYSAGEAIEPDGEWDDRQTPTSY